jgi:hypothetical protein
MISLLPSNSLYYDRTIILWPFFFNKRILPEKSDALEEICWLVLRFINGSSEFVEGFNC